MKKIFIILITGLLWGVCEATGGWVLHLLHAKQFTPVLITIGIIAMSYATFKTKILTAALMVSIVAAFVKFLNVFFLLGRPISWVLNPVIYIVIEGLIFTVISVTIGIIFYKNIDNWLLLPISEKRKYES